MSTTDRTRQTHDRDTPMPPASTLRSRRIRKAGIALITTALVVWTVTPLLMVLSTSFKGSQAIFANPGLIPSEPSLEAYVRVLGQPGFQSAFLNSVIVGVATTALTLAVGVPAAYAFARFNFRGRHLLLLFSLAPRLIPGIGLMLPLYQLAAYLGVLDSRLALVVVFTGTLLPLGTWLLIGFFQQIPREIEEAATVDGARLWPRLRYVVLPLAVPALITIGVLAFREAWNEFELVLALTTSSESRTLPYELYLIEEGRGGLADHPGVAAFVVMTIAPLVLLYTRLEKYIVQGLTAGSTD